MQVELSFKVSEKIFLKDPETTELGRQIISKSIELISELGLEAFTFKKLAQFMEITEATVYRYFENKHKLLLYILNLYWSSLEYTVTTSLLGLSNPKLKIDKVIDIITKELPNLATKIIFNSAHLQNIVIKEGSKAYLVSDVNEINQLHAFKPYKDLCRVMAQIIIDYNPTYPYPHSLASTLLESAHSQDFFSKHLPRLTDISSHGHAEYVANYLKNLVSNVLK